MPDPKPLPSLDELRRVFDFDAKSGVLIWRHRPEMSRAWNARFAGRLAGRHKPCKRNTVTINYSAFAVHRLIFKLSTGAEPPIVDHINRRPDENSDQNLRAANKSLNGANSKDRARLHALPRGVFHNRYSRRNPYRAQIKNEHLGCFPSIELASAAFKAAARARYGEFANA